MHIASIGIDLGKTTFHLVALGERKKILLRMKFWLVNALAELTISVPVPVRKSAHFELPKTAGVASIKDRFQLVPAEVEAADSFTLRVARSHSTTFCL